MAVNIPVPGGPIPPPQIQTQFVWPTQGGFTLTPDAYNVLYQMWAAIQGLGVATAVIQATAILAANQMVNIYDTGGGVFGVRVADATDPDKPAHGFVLKATALAENALVYFSGIIAGQTGLTPGFVYLSDTAPGAASSTAVTTPGEISQQVGIPISDTAFAFQPQGAILL